MKQCPSCNKFSPNDSKFCTSCGNNITSTSIYVADDQPNFGYALLGFLAPIVGFVLYFLWKDQTPNQAKSWLKGAITSVIFSVVLVLLYILFFIIVFIIASNSGQNFN